MFAGILESIVKVWSAVWWVAVPIALFFMLLDLWVLYIHIRYAMGLSWTLLEIKIPKENLKTPKAMEQVFSLMYGIYPVVKIKFKDNYWKGRVADWMSFEIVGYAGGVHFFVRIPSSFRNLLEAAIYAQYPNAEIHEAQDYTQIVPSLIPNETLDLYGMTFKLAREDGYPIKTYEHFEAQEEEQRLDPIAALTEVMSKLKEGETIWLQYVLRPANDDWKKAAEELIDKLSGKSKPKKPGLIEGLIHGAVIFAKNLAHAPLVHPEWPEEKEKESSPATLTPGKGEAIRAIENKISKFGFEATVRVIFIDDREKFSRGNIAAIAGTFRQYNTQNLNAFKVGSATYTSGLFKKRKLYVKKRQMFEDYKNRTMASSVFILNTEELATVYHFPGTPVSAPMLKPIESKRGAPPPDLPTE